MCEINKYTTKINNLLRSFEYKLNIPQEHDFINKLKKIYNELDISMSNLSNIKSIEIKKKHNYNEKTFLQECCEEVYGLKKLSIKDFYKWYREHHTKINLYHDMKHTSEIKNKKMHDKMFSDNPLHKLLYENTFISYDVVHHAESEDLIYEHLKEEKIEIHAFLPKIARKIKYELIIEIIYFMSKLAQVDNFNLELYIFCGKQKKYMTEFCNIITPENINSGLSVKHQYIVIWREEELYKVLIHELVHFFGIDFYLNDDIYKDIKKIFVEKFNINGDDKINESYTEALALTINSFIYSQKYNCTFREVFMKEMLFSSFQVAKILNNCNTNEITNISDIHITQTTSAFSYFVIKWLFLMNIGRLLVFWDKSIFVKNNKNEYKKLYQNIINNDHINLDIINNMIKFIKHQKCNKFIYKTMRMSVHDY